MVRIHGSGMSISGAGGGIDTQARIAMLRKQIQTLRKQMEVVQKKMMDTGDADERKLLSQELDNLSKFVMSIEQQIMQLEVGERQKESMQLAARQQELLEQAMEEKAQAEKKAGRPHP